VGNIIRDALSLAGETASTKGVKAIVPSVSYAGGIVRELMLLLIDILTLQNSKPKLIIGETFTSLGVAFNVRM
jgi:hypothetical protein